MVAAQDLRIGNWVDGDYGIMQVNDINQISNNGNPSINGWDEEDFMPIKLTPEILIACGFENVGFDIYTKQLSKTLYLQIEDRGWGVKNSAGFISLSAVKIKLHQLQNLYYCLTGSELNYKP